MVRVRKLAGGAALLCAAALAACAGAAPAGSELRVEESWARASMAPIGHMDDHDHMDHHGPGAMAEEHGADHMAGHGGAAAHHMPSGATSAAYFVVRNGGAEADRLLSAESEVAGAVELHQSRIEEGGMRMRPIEGVDLPAGGEARLEPGGYHVMLVGLKRELKGGDRFPLTLHFERAGAVMVEVEVRNP